MTSGAVINRQALIRDILDQYPSSIQVFRAHGMDCPECMGAPDETLETGARLCRADIDSLISDLNRLVPEKG
jgi:hybrid cluster-associated redox disulfide protein